MTLKKLNGQAKDDDEISEFVGVHDISSPRYSCHLLKEEKEIYQVT